MGSLGYRLTASSKHRVFHRTESLRHKGSGYRRGCSTVIPSPWLRFQNLDKMDRLVFSPSRSLNRMSQKTQRKGPVSTADRQRALQHSPCFGNPAIPRQARDPWLSPPPCLRKRAPHHYSGQASHDYSWFGFIGNLVFKICLLLEQIQCQKSILYLTV